MAAGQRCSRVGTHVGHWSALLQPVTASHLATATVLSTGQKGQRMGAAERAKRAGQQSSLANVSKAPGVASLCDAVRARDLQESRRRSNLCPPMPPIGLLHSMAVTKRMKGVPAAWQHQSNGRAGRYYLSVSLRASSPAVLAHPDSAEASEARPSRRQDCHSAAPPSPFSRCFNMDGKGVSALNDNLANG